MSETFHKPSIAIIDPNTLAVLGLTHLLESVMPKITLDAYGSFAELEANHPERYFHFFVDVRIVLSHMAFFQAQRHKTIVLVNSLADEDASVGSFHTICVSQSEKQLLRSLLMLEQHAHAHGKNLPSVLKEDAPMADDRSMACPLSAREMEVMALVVKGNINKEIAERLNLSLPTVVSHRKNVMSKLGIHSVSALTIYAVMHGLVDVNEI